MKFTTLTRVSDRKTAERALKTSMNAPSRAIAEQGWNTDACMAALEQSAKESVDLCFDEDFGKSYFENCALPGTSADDYKNRCYLDSQGRLWVAGIRFRNLDLSQPFVGIFVPQFQGQLGANEIEIIESILNDFNMFPVKRVQIQTLNDWPSENQMLGALRWSTDKWIVAGRVETIARNGTPEPRLELKAPIDDSFFESYQEAYKKLQIERPSIAAVLAEEDFDSLAAIRSAGLLSSIELDGKWIGLIAVEHAELFGEPGFLIREEILVESARGRGLGAQVQTLLARNLTKFGNPYLHGTIHSVNVPSLKTAQRASRQIVGCYGFLNQI